MVIKRKYIYQVIQDGGMVILLGALMGFHLWQESAHEWLGVAFLLIVLKHLLLNIHWFRKIRLGDYDLFRSLKLIINLILAGLLIAAIVSGLMLSQHLFPDLSIHNSSDVMRITHMTSVHWLQIAIAIHLGMHWKMLSRFFLQLWSIVEKSLMVKICTLLSILFSIYGLNVFTARNMGDYLLLQVDYAFFDYDESVAVFYFDYIAVTILFAYAVRFLLWFLFFKNN
jgi:hypothetical protein